VESNHVQRELARCMYRRQQQEGKEKRITIGHPRVSGYAPGDMEKITRCMPIPIQPIRCSAKPIRGLGLTPLQSLGGQRLLAAQLPSVGEHSQGTTSQGRIEIGQLEAIIPPFPLRCNPHPVHVACWSGPTHFMQLSPPHASRQCTANHNSAGNPPSTQWH
jgi:hypothetical protein